MTRVWPVTTAAVLCALTLAPAARARVQDSSVNSQNSARNHVVIGCVSREPEGVAALDGRPVYVIIDSRATPPARYRLEGNTEQLQFHVGHTVEIAGLIVAAPAGQAGTPTATLKIQSLTYLSATCGK